MINRADVKLSCEELLDIRRKLVHKYVDFMHEFLSNWKYSDVYGILVAAAVLSVNDCFIETLKYVNMAIERLSCSEYNVEFQKT